MAELITRSVSNDFGKGVIGTLPPLTEPSEFRHVSTAGNIALHTRIAAGPKHRNNHIPDTGDAYLYVDKYTEGQGLYGQAYVYAFRFLVDGLSAYNQDAWREFKSRHAYPDTPVNGVDYSDPASALTGILRGIPQENQVFPQVMQAVDEKLTQNSADSIQEKGFAILNHFLTYISWFRTTHLETLSTYSREDKNQLNWFMNGPFATSLTVLELTQKDTHEFVIANGYSWMATSTADTMGHIGSPGNILNGHIDSNSTMDAAIAELRRAGKYELAQQLLREKPRVTYAVIPWHYYGRFETEIEDPFNGDGYSHPLDLCVLRRNRNPNRFYHISGFPLSDGGSTDGVTLPTTRELDRDTTQAILNYQKIHYRVPHLGQKPLITFLERLGVDLTQPADDWFTHTTWTHEYPSRKSLERFIPISGSSVSRLK